MTFSQADALQMACPIPGHREAGITDLKEQKKDPRCFVGPEMEARAGVEPTYTDLQSGA